MKNQALGPASIPARLQTQVRPMAENDQQESDLEQLERRIEQLILTFPYRIDEMETRNEEKCRLLAKWICRLVTENNPKM